MRNSLKTVAFAAVFALGSSLPARAMHYFVTNLVDNPLTTNHFFSVSSSAGYVQDNGNGSITIWRTNANVDGVYDWGRLDALHYQILQATAPTVQINAVGPTNGGYWLANWLLWDSSYNFLGEPSMQGDTQATGLQTYTVPTTVNGTNVFIYEVRFRMDPFGSSSAGFTFNSIEAIPEPATWAVLLVGTLPFFFRRRDSV
jgi:hypothetical protein